MPAARKALTAASATDPRHCVATGPSCRSSRLSEPYCHEAIERSRRSPFIDPNPPAGPYPPPLFPEGTPNFRGVPPWDDPIITPER